MNRPLDPTVVDRSGAFDATLDSSFVEVAPPPSSEPEESPSRTAGRTTVLPRIEWTGDAAMLVSTSRPRFEARRALGEGGLGEVVAAVDQDIGREVAIKRMRPDVQSPSTVARFVDEIRTLGALEHPNILPIHDVGANDDGSLYFVMPCVRGQTLASIIQQLAAGDPLAHAHWTFERRVHVFRQLLDALAFAHARGYVHRDIKPANVMVGAFGEVFLMDWGIAKPLGASDRPMLFDVPAPAATRAAETHVGALIGTPAYMSPEQARGEAVDARSDVYSLCVLLHEFLYLRHYLDHCASVEEMLAGVKETQASTFDLAAGPHQPPVPVDLAWFVRKGLAKSPADRYPSVRAMMDRLDDRDEGRVPIQCHVTFTKRVIREALRVLDRYPWLFSTTLLVGVLACIGLAIWRLVAR
jgi:serine/threonine-protein kinase